MWMATPHASDTYCGIYNHQKWTYPGIAEIFGAVSVLVAQACFGLDI